MNNQLGQQRKLGEKPRSVGWPRRKRGKVGGSLWGAKGAGKKAKDVRETKKKIKTKGGEGASGNWWGVGANDLGQKNNRKPTLKKKHETEPKKISSGGLTPPVAPSVLASLPLYLKQTSNFSRAINSTFKARGDCCEM